MSKIFSSLILLSATIFSPSSATFATKFVSFVLVLVLVLVLLTFGPIICDIAKVPIITPFKTNISVASLTLSRWLFTYFFISVVTSLTFSLYLSKSKPNSYSNG